jgi:hypothetical protein
LIATQHTTRQIVQVGNGHAISTCKGAHHALGHLLVQHTHLCAALLGMMFAKRNFKSQG